MGVLDGVAQVGERECGSRVLVHGRIAQVGGDELEERDLVDGHLVGGAEVLAVVGGTATLANTMPYGVTLHTGVDATVRLVNARRGVGLELQPQTLEDIPVDGVVAGPVEGLYVVGVNDNIALALRTILELLQVAVNCGAEHEILRHGRDVKVTNDLQPLITQPFSLREWAIVFRIRAERVTDFTIVNKFVVHLHILIALHQLGIGVGEVKVLNIPDMHLAALREVALLADVHQVDILATGDFIGQETQRVARLCSGEVGQLVLHLHIRVQRVVFGLHHRQRVVVVYRDSDVPLLREEQLAAVDIGSEVEIDIGLMRPFGD